MEKDEAKKILDDKLSEYRNLSYSDLVRKIGKQETFDGKNQKGDEYCLEFDFFFDGHEETDIRVLGMISYSFWTDFSPLCSDFIIAPDGKFVGE